MDAQARGPVSGAARRRAPADELWFRQHQPRLVKGEMLPSEQEKRLSLEVVRLRERLADLERQNSALVRRLEALADPVTGADPDAPAPQ